MYGIQNQSILGLR